MDRFFKVSLFLLTILSTTLSSSAFAQAQAVDTKPFEAPPGQAIKTIGLLKIDEPWGYFLGEGGVSSFGLAGILVSTFKRPKHKEYEQAGFRFPDVAERLLTEHLKAAGFNVVSVPVERRKPYQLLPDYKTLSVPNLDAYLDVVSGGIGYRQSDSAPDFAQKVGPYVVISAQLVSARSKEILYADTIEYAWRKGHRTGLPGSEINAPADQVYPDAEAVQMDLMSADSRSLAQLTQGIDLATRRIVSEFSAYPAIELPQQAGSRPRTDSPIAVAKAAALPRGAVSTTYKVGIFPASGCFGSIGDMGCGWIGEKETAQRLAAAVRGNPALALVYSNYEQTLNTPPMRKPDQLWTGKRPNWTAVYTEATERGLDGVLMYRGDGVLVGTITAQDVPIELYAINLIDRQIRNYKGMTNTADKLAKQALSTLLAGAQAKAIATAPTQRAAVKGQAASAGQPFDGITLHPGGSVEAIKAAAEAYCASSNKRSRLIAAPPNNPDYVFQCY
jgi:hypothetical protein